MRQVICLNTEIMQHAGFSFSLFGNCMVVPKIIVIFKLDKETPFNSAFKIRVVYHLYLYSLNSRVTFQKQ